MELGLSKRICLIRQSVFPYELSFLREVKTLKDAGYETHVICLSSKSVAHQHEKEETINGVHVHRLPLTRKKNGFTRYIYDYLSFFILATIKCTVLHLQNPFYAIQVNTMPDFLVFSAVIPKLLRAKVLIMMQEPVPELWETRNNSPPPRILALTEQAALRFADSAFTVTEQLKKTYVSRGADASKINVILNVPEHNILEKKGETNAVHPNPEFFTLICHGAIEERYGHDTMIEAVALVKNRIPNLRLRILGRGSYLDEFLQQVNRLDINEYVDYLGYVPLEKMVSEIRNADVGIVAQKSSPYSNLVHTNKMYEYIAFEKPVLASRLKSVETYFGEEALFYFIPGDAESLAAGILDLFQNPDLRKQLVRNSRNLYRNYQWGVQKETYLEVYREIYEK
jgi:glycosyltransferase involved in cell wall biosynthesis